MTPPSSSSLWWAMGCCLQQNDRETWEQFRERQPHGFSSQTMARHARVGTGIGETQEVGWLGFGYVPFKLRLELRKCLEGTMSLRKGSLRPPGNRLQMALFIVGYAWLCDT